MRGAVCKRGGGRRKGDSAQGKTFPCGEPPKWLRTAIARIVSYQDNNTNWRTGRDSNPWPLPSEALQRFYARERSDLFSTLTYCT